MVRGSVRLTSSSRGILEGNVGRLVPNKPAIFLRTPAYFLLRVTRKSQHLGWLRWNRPNDRVAVLESKERTPRRQVRLLLQPE